MALLDRAAAQVLPRLFRGVYLARRWRSKPGVGLTTAPEASLRRAAETSCSSPSISATISPLLGGALPVAAPT